MAKVVVRAAVLLLGAAGCVGRTSLDVPTWARARADAAPGDRDLIGGDSLPGDTPAGDPHVNQAPTLSLIPAQSVAEGSLLSFALVATDPDNDPLTYSCAANCPAGLNVDAGTGAVTWTPGYDQAGYYGVVVFQVADGVYTLTRLADITVSNVSRYQGWIGRDGTGVATAGWTFGGTTQMGAGDGMFSTPRAIAAISPYFYVADADGERVMRYTAAGTFSGWLGQRASDHQPTNAWQLGDQAEGASGDGAFNNPTGIAVSAVGQLVVADYYNTRVQAFGLDGVWRWAAGHEGTDDLGFTCPMTVAADATGGAYVADRCQARVVRLSASGAASGWIGAIYNPTVTNGWTMSPALSTYGTGDGMFSGPVGVAVDPIGNLYVTEYTNHRIQKFTSAGVFVGWLGEPASTGMPSGGWVTGDRPIRDSGPGAFDSPIGMSIGATGRLYVADYGNHRVQVFNSDGTVVRTVGTEGTGDGELLGPHDVRFDAAGNLYVADTLRVSRFTGAGVFSGWIGRRQSDGMPTTGWTTGDTALAGTGPGEFTSLNALAVDEAGNRLIVADNAANRLQVFDLATGAHITDFFVGGPSFLIVDGGGNLYVTESYNFVGVYDTSYVRTRDFGTSGTGPGGFTNAAGIAIDGTTVYVADYNWTVSGQRVQKWTAAGAFQGWIGKYAPTATTTGWHTGDAGEAGEDDGMLLEPTGVAVDDVRDALLVLDWQRSGVEIFSLSTGAWSRRLSFLDPYGHPQAVAIDPAGHVLAIVADAVEVYDFDSGAFIDVFGANGSGDGQLTDAWGLGVMGWDLFVADGGNHRVQKW